MRVGESKQEYKERMRVAKERRRLEHLLKYGFPRQRELHLFKKLHPEEDLPSLNDIYELKKSQAR